MSQPTVINYLISLPVTCKKDKIESGAQTVLCSQLFPTAFQLCVM